MAHITEVDVSNESWNETNAGLIAVGVFQVRVLLQWLAISMMVLMVHYQKLLKW